MRKSAVNTDLLGEEERRQLCRSASTNGVLELPIQYLEHTDTQELKIYAVDRESEDGQIFRSFVQAFKCPTEPAIYLHISDHDGGHLVWITVEIIIPVQQEVEEAFPSVDFLSYDVKLVKDIIKDNNNDEILIFLTSIFSPLFQCPERTQGWFR